MKIASVAISAAVALVAASALCVPAGAQTRAIAARK